MPTLAELKASSPAYAEMSDMEFASKVYRKHYADKLAFPEFAKRAGFDPYGDAAGADPTEGMSGLDKFMAGVGKSVYDTGRGVGQLAGVVDREDVDAARRRDDALMSTGAGVAGNITGTVAQFVGPGGVAAMGLNTPRLLAAAPKLAPVLSATRAASLPTSLKGAAAQGGVIGAIQQRGEGDSIIANTTLGGLLGWGGAAATKVPGLLGLLGRKTIPAYSDRRQTIAAARVLDQFAENPAAVRAAAASPEIIVPGSRPTLAEASGDIGLAGLQRTLANTPEFGNALSLRGQENNLARVRHIEGAFGGADSAAADAVRATRDQAARRALKPIDRMPMATLNRVVDGVNKVAEKHPASHAVRTAMEALKAELPNIRTVGDAHDVRQYIGTLMAGQVEGKAGAKLAQRELMLARGLLDREMRTAYPEWADFLKTHKAMSREADQIDVGQALLDTGRAVRGATNEAVLQPASFARASGNLDRTVQRATGFSKASAERTLAQPQREAVEAVRRDLERYSRAMTDGKAVGSNTMQNAVGGNRLQDAVGPVGATMIEPASGVAMLAINQARKVYGERVGMLVQEAMLDPARAAEILSRVPAKERAAVLQIAGPALARLSASSGALAVPAWQSNQRPMELDIVGGTPISEAEASRLYGP